jgi:hypothetical protein
MLNKKSYSKMDLMVHTCNLAFGRQRQEDHEFKAGLGCIMSLRPASLGYITRPCLKKEAIFLCQLNTGPVK